MSQRAGDRADHIHQRKLEELQLEGDLLEVMLDQTHTIYRILQAASQPPHDALHTLIQVRGRGCSDHQVYTVKTVFFFFFFIYFIGPIQNGTLHVHLQSCGFTMAAVGTLSPQDHRLCLLCGHYEHFCQAHTEASSPSSKLLPDSQSGITSCMCGLRGRP